MGMSGRVLLGALAISAGLIAFAPRAHAQGKACGGDGPLNYVCGAVNVEDMVQAPGTRWLIGSSMHVGKIPKDVAGLYLIDSQARTVETAVITLAPEPKSGPFAGCAPPDLSQLASHGLELRLGKGGRHILYAINHGGRETLEVFEVDTRGRKLDGPAA